MEYKEFKARTVDDAITSACISYGVSSDRLEYDVITEGKAGIFGFGRKDAVIRARVRTEKERAKETRAIEKAEARDALLKKMPGEAKPAKKAEKKAEKKTEKKTEKKDSSEKNEAKTAKKASPKSEEKTAEKKESVKREEKQAEKKAPVKKEEKKQKAAPESNAFEGKPVEKRTERPQARGIVTADEIEKRAAEAAARAKEAGIDLDEISEDAGKERKHGGRNRRGRGRNDRRDSRRRERFGDERVTIVEEKPHKPSQPKPERVVVPKSEEEIAEMKKTAMDFLTNIFRCMETEVAITMDYDEKEGCLNVTFDGDDMGILIGKRGQTLDSLQYLTSLVINKGHSDYTRVKLDTEDYRKRRADTLENLSRNIAYKVKRTHKAIALEPMNPYERRIIHSSLQNNRYVETYSEGEEPYRHVVVTPKKS